MSGEYGKAGCEVNETIADDVLKAVEAAESEAWAVKDWRELALTYKAIAESCMDVSNLYFKRIGRLEQARAEALAKAADIAAGHNGCIDRRCLNRGGNCGITIAEDIEELARQEVENG